MEASQHRRGGGLPRPCAHASRDTSQGVRLGIHGLPQGKEQPDDLREVSGTPVKIQEQGVLVPGLLRRHDREKRGEDSRLHPATAGGGQVRGTADHAGEDVARLRACR